MKELLLFFEKDVFYEYKKHKLEEGYTRHSASNHIYLCGIQSVNAACKITIYNLNEMKLCF